MTSDHAHQDGIFESLSASRFYSVLAPKVQGTLNLHEATLHLTLSFFVMMGTVGTLASMATQSSYTAANAFLDVFARYRRAQGLPAQTISLGVISDIGFLQFKPEVQRAFERNGLYSMNSTKLMSLFEAAFIPQPSSLSTLATDIKILLSDPLSHAHVITGLEPAKLAHVQQTEGIAYGWHADARLRSLVQAAHHQIRGGSASAARKEGSAAQPIAEALRAASTREELETMVDEWLRERLAKLLLTASKDDIASTRPVALYGVDSMIAAELRNWCSRTFGVGLLVSGDCES